MTMAGIVEMGMSYASNLDILTEVDVNIAGLRYLKLVKKSDIRICSLICFYITS